MPIDVLLADDHAIVREGYRALLEKHADLRVVGEAATGEAAYRACTEMPTGTTRRGARSVSCGRWYWTPRPAGASAT